MDAANPTAPEPPDGGAPAHLNAAAARALSLPREQRIAYMKTKRWIGYPKAKAALERLEELCDQPRGDRMDCLLIYGHTDNGKTWIVKRFRTLHPSVNDPEAPAALHPIVYVQAPPTPRESQFYDGILRAVDAPFRASASAAVKQDQVLTLLRAVGTRVLIIDEIHHLIAGPTARQREFRNVLKFIANELQIPMVAAGIEDAHAAFRSDPQLDNRFRKFALPRWTYGRGESGDLLRQLLASFERTLPLHRPSYLADRHALTVHNASDGLIGGVARLLIRAAVLAVRRGVECIDTDVLSAAAEE